MSKDRDPTRAEREPCLLNNQEISMILAGLRLLQSKVSPFDIREIATNGGLYPVPSEHDIDELCLRLNFGETE